MESKYGFEEKKVGASIMKVYADRPQTVYSMFSKTVEGYPDRQAMIYGDLRLTYADLSRRVDALAAFLKNDGRVEKGDRVAIFLRNDDAFPTAFLAISKIGAISVDNPGRRLGQFQLIGESGLVRRVFRTTERRRSSTAPETPSETHRHFGGTSPPGLLFPHGVIFQEGGQCIDPVIQFGIGQPNDPRLLTAWRLG